jgi:2-dehydropantoate 2-reductase
MKFLIIGTGGTGGSIGGFLASAGYDVTFIARGKHLGHMKEKGLKIKSALKGEIILPVVQACEAKSYTDKADVIFLCIKSYSIDDIMPFLQRASHKDTIVIPILNGIGIGDKIYEKFKEAYIVDGCIYIVAYMASPGEIVQSSGIFKVVFGSRENQPVPLDKLEAVKDALCSSGIQGVISDNIVKDTFQKFSFISPYAACGVYYNITAGQMREIDEYRQMYVNLSEEIKSIANALNISSSADIPAANLKLLNSLTPDTTASLQKDFLAGRQTETDGLIFEVIRLAEKHGVDVSNYRQVAQKFGYTI